MLFRGVCRARGLVRSRAPRGFFSIKNDSGLDDTVNQECLALRRKLQPINDRVGGPLEKNSEKNTMLPFVFLLGNHSSGKSSFINYVIQRKVRDVTINTIYLLSHRLSFITS